MDFLRMVHEEGDLLGPYLFPTKGVLVPWGVVADFYSSEETLGEGCAVSFDFIGDQLSFATHNTDFLKIDY